jgi:hypothetical protein
MSREIVISSGSEGEALYQQLAQRKRQKLKEKKRKAKARKAATAGKEEKQRDADDWQAWEEATITHAGLVPPS